MKQLNMSLEKAQTDLAKAEQAVKSNRIQVAKIQAAMESINSIDPSVLGELGQFSDSADVKPRSRSTGLVPDTRAEFWLGLITDQHQKTAELLKKATEKLEVTEEKGIALIKQRLTFYLKKYTDEGKIHSQGKQQNRTYFL